MRIVWLGLLSGLLIALLGGASSTVAATAVDPVIAAAGDIACDSVAKTSGATCHYSATAARVTADPAIADVLTLGDNQYECGDYSSLLKFYDPTWGVFRSRTHPAIGNHEYLTAPGTTACDPASTTAAKGYFDYWNGTGVGSGPAGDRIKGYYSYDVGSWHLIALNSNCSRVGGCGVGSAQETWLRNDLASHPAACTLAYWHHPRFSSGEHGNNPSVGPLWDALYQAGAEIVLNGHDHDYERFAPQTPGAAVDAGLGIREFVVGTGGKSHYAFPAAAQPNSIVRNADTFGVLKLTLHAQGYDWLFSPEAGGSFTDAGSGSCHSSNADTTPPSKPVVTATPASTSVALTWPPATDNVAVSRYDVTRGGVLVGTVAQPASGNVSFTDTGRTPSTTYTYVVTAVDTAGNSTPSNPVTVTTTATTAAATTTTVVATADAKVDASLPSTNYGTTALRVDASPDVRSYLKFDASALTGTVQSATLRVWATSSQSTGFDAFAVADSSWIEPGITYDNQPSTAIATTKLGSSGAVAASTWTTVDVKPLLTGPGVYSVVLKTTGATALALSSREDTAHSPQLVITTS